MHKHSIPNGFGMKTKHTQHPTSGNWTQSFRQWLGKMKSHLLNPVPHGVTHVLASLNAMKPEDNIKLEAKRKTINYLKTNIHRLNYGLAKAQGLTIGPGGMESANKYIAHSRLKRCGAWWKPTHANEMLRLKCAKANGTLQGIISTKLYEPRG